MPNINAPSGLAPVSYLNGSTWNGQCRLYRYAAAQTGALYIGDPVIIDGTNFAGPDGIPYVAKAAANSTLRGVVVGIGLAVPTGYQGGMYANANNLAVLPRPSGAQSSDYIIAVVDDPNVVYEIQEDTTTTPGQAAAMSKNAQLNVAGTPGTGVNVSAVMLNSNTYVTTAATVLKVLQAVQRPDNTPFTAWQKLLVKINQHDFSAPTAGV